MSCYIVLFHVAVTDLSSPRLLTLKVLATTIEALGHLNKMITAQWEEMGMGGAGGGGVVQGGLDTSRDYFPHAYL